MSPWFSWMNSKPSVNLASSLLPDSCWFLAWLNIQPWSWKRHVSPKLLLTSNGLHGVILQNIETFITTGVRTSNPANCSLVSFYFVSFFLVCGGGVRLSPLVTSATIWPIVPAPGDRWWVWSSRWNKNCQGKPKYSEKTCPSTTLPTTNPTWPDLGSNPGRRGGKPANNRLSYGTACVLCFVVWTVLYDYPVYWCTR
jgi:hypothetical protein